VRGVALVMTLSVLALLVLLVVAILGLATGTRSGASWGAGQERLVELQQVTASVVVAQLRAATGHAGEAWVSQPGALRRYGLGGEFVAGHRLYSSDRSVVSVEQELAGDRPAGDWAARPSEWVDLNAPGLAGGRVSFPILDPRAAATGVGQGGLEGFSLDPNFPGVRVGGDERGLRAPMPVRWLYVLADGHLGVVDGAGDYVGAGVASEGNPIVGRIAYWSDDETCKLPINTASAPTYWDTPRAYSAHSTSQGLNQSQVLQDLAYARFQPAQREYQRYPGHPAMNCLSPVLFPGPLRHLSPSQKETIYEMIPRIATGGSRGGSVVVQETTGLQPGGDRLYASADEFLFPPERVPHSMLDADGLGRAGFFLTSHSRAPELNLHGGPRVAVWPTHVRASDGSGRALRTGYDNLIRFCATVGMGGSLYGFQREDNRSPTADWVNIPRNRELLRYLRRLTGAETPGYGGRIVDKLGGEDRDQMLVQILDYVRSTNLYDDNLQPTRYGSAAEEVVQFTSGRRTNDSGGAYAFQGHGEVAPLRVPADFGTSYPGQPDRSSLMGFGRFFTISEAGLLFLCCADGGDGGAGGVAGSNVTGNRTLGGTLLGANERRVQMMVLFEWTSPAQGWTQHQPDLSIEVEQVGGRFRLGSSEAELQDLGIPTVVSVDIPSNLLAGWGVHHWGGGSSYRGFIGNRHVPARSPMPADGTGGRREYGLVSVPVTVSTSGGTMAFAGPERVDVRLYAGTSAVPGDRHLVQTIELDFPAARFPLPILKVDGTSYDTPGGLNSGAAQTVKENWWTFHADGPGMGLTGAQAHGRLGRGTGPTSALPTQRPQQYCGSTIRPEDTFRSLVPYHGDVRLVAASHHVPAGVFKPSSYYFYPERAHSVKSHMTGSAGSAYDWVANFQPGSADRLVPGVNYNSMRFPDFPMFADPGSPSTRRSASPFQRLGDFDQGIATTYDGAYINKPDDGNTYRIADGGIPYFSENWRQTSAGESYFSPNRQMPGPGMMGSLPARLRTGNRAFDPAQPDAKLDAPWRTLLFRPQAGHPGGDGLPDHLWLDLFWMPVVEPWAISEPLSTAGKVNLNYQILPFGHVRRATAMHGVLRSEEMLILPNSQGPNYKASTAVPRLRYPIDVEATLGQFDELFGAGDIFRSASAICEMALVPEGHTAAPTAANMAAFWQAHALTGDNSRERPYTNLQPRLTVRSNSYRVHYRVQAIQKVRSAPPGRFVEGQDQVVGERRGHHVIERFLDPRDPEIPDHATEPGAASLDRLYQYRILESGQFR
jgi:uncharacterized protein (TIGR02600 family)